MDAACHFDGSAQEEKQRVGEGHEIKYRVADDLEDRDIYSELYRALDSVIDAAVDHIVYGGSALLTQERICAGS